jgi:hypothetical protein
LWRSYPCLFVSPFSSVPLHFPALIIDMITSPVHLL